VLDAYALAAFKSRRSPPHAYDHPINRIAELLPWNVRLDAATPA
jgi:hypothetical protein